MPTGDPFMVERLTPRQRDMIAPHVCQCEQQKQRIAQLEADLAAARKEIARLKNAVRGFRCTCYCNVHGPGCGAQESTCRGIVRCDRCAAIDAARAGGGR